MDADEYQSLAVSTAVYNEYDPNFNKRVQGILYCALQLASEAGEVAGKIAKLYLRGDFGGRTEDAIDAAEREIVLELGDVQWYLANLADLFDNTLSDVMVENIDKLRKRKEAGTLKGSGDQR